LKICQRGRINEAPARVKIHDTEHKKYYSVESWVFDGTGITGHVATIEHSTDKAHLFRFTDGLCAWVPKSACKEVGVKTTLEGWI